MKKNKLVKFYFKNINCSYKKLTSYLNNIKCLNIKNFLIYLNFYNNKYSRILLKNLKKCIKTFFFNFKKKISFYKIFTLKGSINKKIDYKAKGGFGIIKKIYCNILIYLL